MDNITKLADKYDEQNYPRYDKQKVGLEDLKEAFYSDQDTEPYKNPYSRQVGLVVSSEVKYVGLTDLKEQANTDELAEFAAEFSELVTD